MAKRSPYTIASFDTGERTGWCLVRVQPRYKPEAKAAFRILNQGVLTVNGIFTELENLIAQADVVVYEAWRLYETHALAMVGNDMQPSQVVGMVRYEAFKHNKKIVSQGAGYKKPAWTTMPDWLKDHCGKSSEQHDVDAIMHAWFFSFDRYHKDRRDLTRSRVSSGSN